MPEGQVVADYEKYSDAVDCVDALIRHDFPAINIAIIGSGLRSVERVRARITYGRVALRGVTQGIVLGLFYWLLVGGAGVEDEAAAIAAAQQALLPSIIIGAGLGMLVQIAFFAVSKSQREFISFSSMVASSYEVVVPNQMHELARQKLAEHQTQCLDAKN
jgi:hypothetical protein